MTRTRRFAGQTETRPENERNGPERSGFGDCRRTGTGPVRQHQDRDRRGKRKGIPGWANGVRAV